ncbi:MAG: DUF58 domain-containing protein [Herpetosiphon sp.]
MAARRLSALAIVGFFLAVAFHSVLLATVVAMLCLVILVGAIWIRHVQRGLHIVHAVPSVVSWNEATAVEITVENRSRWPVPWLEIAERIPTALRITMPSAYVFRLPAGATWKLSIPLQSRRRGWYHIGPLNVRTGDVLGLRSVSIDGGGVDFVVYPQVLPVSQLLLPSAQHFGPLNAPRNWSEDPARPHGIRPYGPGDSSRRIDWKSSARSGELLVRRSDPSQGGDTYIALSCAMEDYPVRVVQDALERAIVAAASLATAILARKLAVGIISNGVDPRYQRRNVVIPLHKGAAQQEIILEALGRIEAGTDESIWAVLANHSLGWGSTLLLVLADFDAASALHVVGLLRRGQHVALVLVEPSLMGQALAREYGLVCYNVDRRGTPMQHDLRRND